MMKRPGPSYKTQRDRRLSIAQLLESLHARWVVLLKSMRPEDFQRKLNHPESGVHDADWLLALYGWHGNHHLAHITSLQERMNGRLTLIARHRE